MSHAIIANESHIKSLALTIARNRVGPRDPIEEVLARECVSPEEFDHLADDPLFKTYVQKYVHDLTENGVSFQMKAKLLAEDILPDIYSIVRDRELPAQARIKAAENLVEWADLKPRQSMNAADSGPKFSIIITPPPGYVLPAGNAPQTMTITASQDATAERLPAFEPVPLSDDIDDDTIYPD
jgi:hypothetical protein